MYPTVRHGCVLLLIAATTGCEVVDRVRDRARGEDAPGASASSGGLTLALQIPGMLRAGQEGTIRLSLTNRGDSVPEDIRLDLIVPGWMELAPPRPGDREVTMSADAETGTRFSYRMDDPPLGPGETQLVEQRIRIPLQDDATRRGRPLSRIVRARLVSAEGQPLTEVQSEISLDTADFGSAELAAAESDAAEQREQLGPVSLGMPATELRQAASSARDTTWPQEGTTERGLVLPIGGGGHALAVLDNDSVLRIEVRDTLVRTREGLGVGSRLESLRAAYGRSCAGIGEGIVVVWFPAAPGISFALDTPLSAVPNVDQQPERLPGSARVTRWWLRRGTDQCR